MSTAEDDELLFQPAPVRYTKPVTPLQAANVVTLKSITLRIYIRYDRGGHVKALINELKQSNGEKRSTLDQYVLESTCDPIDMSNQDKRLSYQPNLFIRRNDAHGPWISHHLLTLLSLDYCCETELPAIWKTNEDTKVQVMTFEPGETKISARGAAPMTTSNDDRTLKSFFETICRQNQRNESLAGKWLADFEGKQWKQINLI